MRINTTSTAMINVLVDRIDASVAAETWSFSEATKMGRGFMPSRNNDRTRRLTGCSPAPCRSAR